MTGAIPALQFEIDPRRFLSDIARMEVALRTLGREAASVNATLRTLGGVADLSGLRPPGAPGTFVPFGPGGGGGGRGGGGRGGGRFPGGAAGLAAGGALGGRFGFGGAIAGLSAFQGLRSSISTIADFEQAIATLQGVTGATGQTLQALEETARQLGATTKFTATEAAEGLLELARAGLSANDAIAGLPATLDLAQAGLLGLGEASDLATNVAAQFGLGARDIERIGDSLVAVANRSNTDVAQLGQGLKDVGGVAAGLGTDLETTVAALGVLANVGLKGSDASIKLRQAFLQLLEPSAGAQAKLAEMGLSLEDVDIQARGLIPVLESLRDAQADVRDTASLVGARNALALSVLSENVDRLKALREETVAARGETARLAALQRDTLSGSLKSAASAVQELQLAIGEGGLNTAARATVDLFTDVVRELAGVQDGARAATPLVQGLAVALESVAVAAGVGGSIAAGRGLLGLLARLGSINPFVGVITGAAAAVTALDSVAEKLRENERLQNRVAERIARRGVGRDLSEALANAPGLGSDAARQSVSGFTLDDIIKAVRRADNLQTVDRDVLSPFLTGARSRDLAGLQEDIASGLLDAINRALRSGALDPSQADINRAGVNAASEQIGREQALALLLAQQRANGGGREIRVDTVSGPQFDTSRGLGNRFFVTGGGDSGSRPPFQFQTNDVVAGLQQEAEALRRVGAEREAYIVAIQNGIPATEGNIAALREQIDVLERLGQSERIADGIASSIINIGVAADLAAGNTERAVERMVRALSDLALQELALQPLRQALQSFVGGLVAGATPRQGYDGSGGYGAGVFLNGTRVDT